VSQSTDRRPRAEDRWPASLVVLLVCAVVGAGLLVWVLAVKLGPAGDEPLAQEGVEAPKEAVPVVEAADGQPKPAVLWAYKAQSNFLASPVPTRDGLLVPALGVYGTGAFYCLAMEQHPPNRVRWVKEDPYLKRPTVSRPAVNGGWIVFGDGMHQTHDAHLYCIEAGSGLPVWKLPVPGEVVHLEGSPAIEEGRVYVGGGEAGILCVDLRRVNIDGRERDVLEARDIVRKRWAEMARAFDAQKKKDPDFATPPSDQAMPKAAPRLLWQAGQKRWHVDAQVALVGGRVLAASARIENEGLGTRSLVCLRAADGTLVWEKPLAHNPWGGPTVAGESVLVGCSSIRREPGRVEEAQGEVVKIGLGSGEVQWRVAVPGGVLSPVVVRDGVAVFTATDGNLWALETATGKERWSYRSGNRFFAGAAVADGVVYTADLGAVVHAVRLEDGAKLWTLDVGADPAVQQPGMVYATPAVADGRIYVATCNVAGKSAGQPSAVVCIAEQAGLRKAATEAAVTVDKSRKTVSVPCRVAQRQLPDLKEVYPVEVIATRPAPTGQKAHETVIVADVKPSRVQEALLALGLAPGKPAKGQQGTAAGPALRLLLEFPGPNGRPRTIPVEKTLVDKRTGRPLPEVTWHFTGSVMREPDPGKSEETFGADASGTLIALFPVTDETVIQSSLTMVEESLLTLDTDKAVLPPEGTEGRLIIAVLEDVPAVEREKMPGMERMPLPPLAHTPVAAAVDAVLPAPVPLWMPAADAGYESTPPFVAGGGPTRPSDGTPAATAPVAYGSVPLPARLSVPPLPHDDAKDGVPIGLTPAVGWQRRRSRQPEDSTDVLLKEFLLSIAVGVRTEPAPFLELRIPDPFAAAEAVKLRKPLPEDDPPASAASPLSWPTLPTRE
jgi:outer membrane protein assembly factor BamB